eukprot:CAMPEP_0182538840 /NCGR_PEP_ID=MMETSP1323-20130603/24360_1 /TAXON_ID=236787 /ORGANISM="Florenciella parvula, Strain RCC1693" /LENGTH=175 /DNA_ID=CAMNT_0024749343 /DNA_START=110 /DNA_END=633 /DNA_ORIENTATION=-
MTPGLYRDTCFSERIQQVRRKAGSALVTIAKAVPGRLELHLDDLAFKVNTLMTRDTLTDMQHMHCLELLIVVSNAVTDPQRRVDIVGQIVAPSLEEWVSPSTEAMVCTPSALLEAMALDVPRAAQDDEVVRRVHKGVNKVANTLNTLHSISRRIHETNRATPGSAAAASGGAGVG